MLEVAAVLFALAALAGIILVLRHGIGRVDS